MDRDKFIDLIRPNSGCKLAESMSFSMFQGLCERTKNICDGCAFNPCEKMRKDKERDKAMRRANFGTHTHKTNAEIAKEMGISKRQVSKMKKKGEL